MRRKGTGGNGLHTIKRICFVAVVVAVLALSACNKPDYSVGEDSQKEVQVKEEESVRNPNAELITEGKTAVVPDSCELELDYISISKDVKPKDPGSTYSQYSADDNKVYVDLCVAYKNLDTSAISAYDTMKCSLLYAGKYEYSGFSMMEVENRSNFEHSKSAVVSPLTTEFIHYLFEVPDEVRTSGQEIEIFMKVGGKDFKVEAEPSVIDRTSEEIHPGQNAEIVRSKEVNITDCCEFSVNGATITNDVVPPNPGDYYAHFEAEPGKMIVDATIYYKNTSSTKKSVNEIGKSTLVLDERYEYAGFVVAEKSDGTEFTDADVTDILPLETGCIHHLFMVPEEIGKSKDPVYICFVIDGTEYKYIMR